jgi:hypothetical protein
MSIPSTWRAGQCLFEARVEKPVLALWDAKNAPSQIRLTSYLSELIPRLGPLPSSDEPLFLDFQIGVSTPERLLVACDLENYLFPLFGAKWLPPNRFVLVSASKQVGIQHRITIGIACPEQPPSHGWQVAAVSAGAGYTTKRWKERVREELALKAMPLPPGAAHVQIAFQCAQGRNWTNLWKPAGDCMGPILGENRQYGFNPCDDRIVELRLHRVIDSTCGHDIRLHFWWRPATARRNDGSDAPCPC